MKLCIVCENPIPQSELMAKKLRKTCGYLCSCELKRARRRECSRRFSQKNPDKVRAYSRAYSAADPERRNKKHGEWVAKNRDHVRSYMKNWRQRNHDALRMRQSERMKKITDLFAVLRAEHPELLKEIGL